MDELSVHDTKQSDATTTPTTLAEFHRTVVGPLQDFAKMMQTVLGSGTEATPKTAPEAIDEADGTRPAIYATKRSDRRKADYETVQREARIAADWERARESGVYKPEFAKERKMPLKELEKLLNRVSKRKKRSDNER